MLFKFQGGNIHASPLPESSLQATGKLDFILVHLSIHPQLGSVLLLLIVKPNVMKVIHNVYYLLQNTDQMQIWVSSLSLFQSYVPFQMIKLLNLPFFHPQQIAMKLYSRCLLQNVSPNTDKLQILVVSRKLLQSCVPLYMKKKC